MIRRIKKHLSPGLVLSLIALVVAVGGTSIAVAQNGTDNTLRTRLGGATEQVVLNVTLLPQNQNNGISDHLVTCPSNPKLGAGVALGGGVIDQRPPDTNRNFAPLTQKTDGPSGTVVLGRALRQLAAPPSEGRAAFGGLPGKRGDFSAAVPGGQPVPPCARAGG